MSHHTTFEGLPWWTTHQAGVLPKKGRPVSSTLDSCHRPADKPKESQRTPHVWKVANRCVFLMIRGSGCSKSRLAKAAGAEVAVQQRNEKWHAAVARSTFASHNVQNAFFWGSDPEKWHAAVAPSAFASQNVQNTSAPAQVLKFRSRKMARRCGAKRVCKSTCTKHLQLQLNFWSSDLETWHAAVVFGPLFEAQMSKNRTPLWREEHLL